MDNLYLYCTEIEGPKKLLVIEPKKRSEDHILKFYFLQNISVKLLPSSAEKRTLIYILYSLIIYLTFSCYLLDSLDTLQ